MIENGNKQHGCYHFTYTAFAVRMEVVLMVESAMLVTIKLLFFGLVGVTIINVALIIVLAIVISKQ